MNQFYLVENGQRTGPFSIEELKGKPVYSETFVWTEGLEKWTKAEHISILKDIIKISPPPIPEEIENANKKINSEPIPEISNISKPAIDKYFGYTLAKRRQRIYALLAEYFILFLPVFFLGMLTNISFGELNYWDLNVEDFWEYLSHTGILSVILGAVFYPLFSGNLGHKIMGLKVISAKDGNDYKKAWQGALREALKSVFGKFVLPNLWILFDNNKQNLYDKITNTFVVVVKD